MRTIIFIPPLPRMSGGLAVLYQVAERLRELGLPVALTSTQAGRSGAPGLEERRAEGFAVLPWVELDLAADDCFLAPEGWPNALAPAFRAGSRALVYAQNWAYLLSGLPAGVSWQRLPAAFLAVSQPVAWFVEELLGLPLAGTLRPAVDTRTFRPGPKPQDRVRVAWMPRKNKALGEQIRRITEALLVSRPLPLPLEWVELHRMGKDEVAAELASCHVFLSTGFPEGLGLPPLEAMACGCLPVGFSGFGGWDYMRQAGPDGLDSHAPPFPLRDVAWSGNGFYSPDGDVISAARQLEAALRLAASNDPALDEMLAQGKSAADSYSPDAQRESVAALWSAL